MADGDNTMQSLIPNILTAGAPMALFGGLINLLSDGKTQYTVVEGGEQAEILQEINLTLKNIDAKLEKVAEKIKDIGSAICNKG